MKPDYSKLKFKLDRRCITFKDCILMACDMPEFAKQIDRLYLTNIIRVSKATGIEAIIDKATGFLEDETDNFIAIVWDLVWLRISPELRITTPQYEQYLHDKYSKILAKLEQNQPTQ